MNRLEKMKSNLFMGRVLRVGVCCCTGIAEFAVGTYAYQQREKRVVSDALRMSRLSVSSEVGFSRSSGEGFSMDTLAGPVLWTGMLTEKAY